MDLTRNMPIILNNYIFLKISIVRYGGERMAIWVSVLLLLISIVGIIYISKQKNWTSVGKRCMLIILLYALFGVTLCYLFLSLIFIGSI